MQNEDFQARGVAPLMRFAAPLAVAVALIAAALTLLPPAPVDAQTGLNLHPAAEFERIGPDGEVADGLYYSADPDDVNIVRISFRASAHDTDASPTYLDFGRLDILHESTTGTNLHPYAAVRTWWVTRDGGTLAPCSENEDWSRCFISKQAYQALAGQTGAADSAVIKPITIGFKVPNTVTDEKIILRVKHTVTGSNSGATRLGSSNVWTFSTWTRVDPNTVLVSPLNVDGEPIPGDFVFSNAAGNLGANIQHVRFSVGAGHISGFSSPTYASWGTNQFSGIWVRVFDRPDGQSGRVDLANGQIGSVFFKSDGTTALPCSNTRTDQCFLTKSIYQGLAGQTGAADTEPIKPISLAFKVPQQSSGGTAGSGNVVELQINRYASVGNATDLFTRTLFNRLTAHVHRYQSASRAASGVRSKFEPGTLASPMALPDGSTHSGLPCQVSSTGVLDAGTDCSRDIEIGERLYVAQGVLAGGSPNSAGYLNSTGAAALQYAPEHFDEIEVSYVPADSNPGDAIVFHHNLCPVELPAVPEHPFVDAPRDRTAAELRVCKFDFRYFGDRYRSVDNPTGTEYHDAGTGPAVIGTKAGDGSIAAKYYKNYGGNRVLVAENSFPITIAAATAARLSSDASDPMIIAELGQRATDDSLTLLVGYQRATGIPFRWSSALKIGGIGYVGPARYEDISSVALTVPAGGGELELLGTAHSCTADSASCTLVLDRSALQQAARYGLTASQTSGAIADTDPIWPPSLRLRHASANDVTISGVLTLADGTTTYNFSYTAKAAPAPAIVIRARPRGDADGILAPGQTSPVAVGYQLPPDDVWSNRDSDSDGTFKYPQYIYGSSTDLELISTISRSTTDAIPASAELAGQPPIIPAAARGTVQALPQRQSDWDWQSYSAGGADFDINPGDLVWHGPGAPPLSARYGPVPAAWVVDSYVRTTDIPARSGQVDRTQAADMTGAYLIISGPATWTDSGGRRLRLDRAYSGKTYDHLTCIDSASLASGLEGRTCYVTDSEGNAPSITVAADASSGDLTFTASLPIWQMIGAGPAWGIRGSVVDNGVERPENTHAVRLVEAFGSARIGVRSIDQLNSIAFGRKPGANGVIPTAPIRIGSTSSEIRLALRNENGQASQLSAVSAITVTVIGGGTLSGQGCTNATSCTISTTSGALFTAVQADPGKAAQIDLRYNAPAKPGDATIRATVVGADGSTFTEAVDLVISGNAAELAIGGEMPRVHSSATANDDRDKILIPISAQDANGNPAPLPRNAAATVRGVNGAALPASSHTAAVKCEGGDNEARLECNIEIIVTASASQPLGSGAYTATVTGTGIGRTEAGFAVGGPPATLSISVPDSLPGLAQTFTAEVAVVDAAGVPVADGTWVAFSTTATGGGSPSAVVTSPAAADVDHDGDPGTAAVSQRRAQTKNGEVSANVTVVGNGVSVLTASAGSGAALKSASEALDTRTAALPAAAAAAGPVLEYNVPDEQPATGAWATYRGGAVTTADELLDDAAAPAEASIVWLWNGVEWIRYGEADGSPIPGSQAFFILPDDTVWFGD